MHDTEDNKIVTGREHDSDESQILEEELSRKTELMSLNYNCKLNTFQIS